MKVIVPHAEQIGFEIVDIDLAASSASLIESIKQLIYIHKLVILRNQRITPDQYVAFAKKLGIPQIYFGKNYHHPTYPEIFVSANIPIDGNKIGVSGTGQYWHTDCAFQSEPLSFFVWRS